MAGERVLYQERCRLRTHDQAAAQRARRVTRRALLRVASVPQPEKRRYASAVLRIQAPSDSTPPRVLVFRSLQIARWKQARSATCPSAQRTARFAFRTAVSLLQLQDRAVRRWRQS